MKHYTRDQPSDSLDPSLRYSNATLELVPLPGSRWALLSRGQKGVLWEGAQAEFPGFDQLQAWSDAAQARHLQRVGRAERVGVQAGSGRQEISASLDDLGL